jgi:hypothetical protein
MKTGRIWVFDENRLEQSLQDYAKASLEAYPDQEERIRITVAAMRDFLYSDFADSLIMDNPGE